MKQISTLAALLCAVTMATAATPSADNGPEAYYPAPDGVFYLGVDLKGNQPGAEYALAPAGTDLTFKAAIADDFNGDYAWDMSAWKMSEVDNADLTVRHDVGLADAPTLYVVDRSGYNTYQMARDGIAFGYGYLPDASGNEYFAANYNPAELKATFYSGSLLTNYPAATTQLNSELAESGMPYKDVTCHGFAESFSYATAYVLKGIHAGVFSDESLTTADVVAKVFAISPDGTVAVQPMATLTADKMVKHDDIFYGVNLTAASDIIVTSPIMVVITNAKGSTKHLGPEMLVTQQNHEGEKGTCTLWADYTLAGNNVSDGFIPYDGNTYTSYGRTFYMKHWNVSIKQDYNVPTSISGVRADGAATDGSVYTIGGVKVGSGKSLQQMPSGIYIVGGRKVLKK